MRKMAIPVDERKIRIRNAIQEFRKDAEGLLQIESQIDDIVELVERKEKALRAVAQEERMREKAEEVLFPGVQKGPSQTQELEGEVVALKGEIASLQDRQGKIKTQLTRSMYNLPIPVDLDNVRHEEGKTIFPFFEKTEFGETIVLVMRKLLKMEQLEFQGVNILQDRVFVDSGSINEGTTKLVSGIKAYRFKLAEILEAYEQIDAMVERAVRSDLYSRILRVLLSKKEMSNTDIAKELGEDERKVYDSCYNLTRDSWSAKPLENTESGKWALTISGEILANRLLEKYPEKTGTTSEVETSAGP